MCEGFPCEVSDWTEKTSCAWVEAFLSDSHITVPAAQFARKVREKFPQYASLADDRLIEFFVKQNPQYRVTYEGTTPVRVSWDRPAPVPALADQATAVAVPSAEKKANSKIESTLAPTKQCVACEAAIPQVAKFCLECGASQNPMPEANATPSAPEATANPVLTWQSEAVATPTARPSWHESATDGTPEEPYRTQPMDEEPESGAAKSPAKHPYESNGSLRNKCIAIGLVAVVVISAGLTAVRNRGKDVQLADGTKIFGERTLKDGTVRMRRIEFPNGEKNFGETRFPDGTTKAARVEFRDGSMNFDTIWLPDGSQKIARIEVPDGQKRFDVTIRPDHTENTGRDEFPDGKKRFDVTILPDGTQKIGRIEFPDGSENFDVTILPHVAQENGRGESKKDFAMTNLPDGTQKIGRGKSIKQNQNFEVTPLPNGTKAVAVGGFYAGMAWKDAEAMLNRQRATCAKGSGVGENPHAKTCVIKYRAKQGNATYLGFYDDHLYVIVSNCRVSGRDSCVVFGNALKEVKHSFGPGRMSVRKSANGSDLPCWRVGDVTYFADHNPDDLSQVEVYDFKYAPPSVQAQRSDDPVCTGTAN